MTTSKSFKIIEWNSNGIKNKTYELTHYLHTHDIDIALITETHLKNTDKLNITNYTIHRKDRPTQGGGVAIMIKNTINYVLIQNLQSNLEILGIKIKNDINIFALYIHPNYALTLQELDNIFDGRNKVIVAGDLNARHTFWKNQTNNTNGLLLYNYYLNSNINIEHTEEPTHYPPNGMTPTYIDIILNKNTNELTNLDTDTALSSDHNPITFEIKIDNSNDENETKTRRTFRNTNWKNFKTDLDRLITLNNTIETPTQLEDEVKKITANIQKTIEKHTITETVKPNTSALPDDIKELIKTKNKTRKLWQRTRNPHTKATLNQQTRQIKDALLDIYNQNWYRKLQDTNTDTKKLWRITKTLKRQQENIPTLEQTGQQYWTDKEKAEIMATTYAKIQSNDSTSTIEDEVNETVRQLTENPQHITPESLTTLITNPTEIANIIRHLPNNKAPGPDNIPNFVLKKLTKKYIIQITYIINAVLKLQTFPNTWKNAVVIPVHKKGKNRHDPLNYRPISLLDSLGKLTEKIIHKRLTDHNEQNNTIIDEQFGFRKGHDTNMQIIRITNDIIQNYNKEKVTVMTLLDIQKAFDTVWIEGLIHKMSKFKVPKHLIKLLHSYLTFRTIQVKINNTTSNKHYTKAGVPQGSILGPTLFNYFINDIPKFEKTQIALYADDTAIYAHSYYTQAATLQNQIHVNKILNYCSIWKIKINREKTETITFTRKFTNIRSMQTLKVEGKAINPSNHIKYLGVWLDTRLKFHTHVQKTVSKFHTCLKLLYSLLNKNSKLNQENKKLLYTSIIRPIITYAPPVLTMTSKTQQTKLQRLQNKCIRLILTADRYTTVHDLHQRTQLPTLTEYIHTLTQQFYTAQIQNSRLTRHFRNNPQGTHRLPHEFLRQN